MKSLGGLILAGSLLPGQAPIPTEPVTKAQFRDQALALGYSYPAAFQPAPGVAASIQKSFADRAAADPDGAALARCLSVPLVATKGTGAAGSGEFGMIVMMKADYRCAGQQSGPEYLGQDAQRLMGILKQFGTPITEDALTYKLSGKPAAFVKGSARAKMLGDGAMLHAASVCTLVGEASLCWLILDTDYKAMPALVANVVTIDSSTPVPLVPAGIVSKW